MVDISVLGDAEKENVNFCENLKIAKESEATITKCLAIIEKAEEDKKRAYADNKKIAWKPLSTEETKLIRHRVSPSHRVVIAIEKWRICADMKNNKSLMENLDSMTVIAEDELELWDWTVVKLGYPDIEADNKEIFEQIVKDTEGREVRAVYFKNKKGGSFEKFMKEMKQKGFRIAWAENDKYWIIRTQELKRIFDMIVKEWDLKYSAIIVDILWRAFSGFRETGWNFCYVGNEESFISCSPTSTENLAHYCYLSRGGNAPIFFPSPRKLGYWVLLFKNKKID